MTDRAPCRPVRRFLPGTRLCAALLLACAAPLAGAQATLLDPLAIGQGDGTARPNAASAAPAAPGAAATAPGAVPGQPVPVPPAAPLPLPADPATSPQPLVFGTQLFSGRLGSQNFSGFNPDYQVAVGDRVAIRMWGAFTYEAVQPVDTQGNVFVPNVGPIAVRGVRNAELNRVVGEQVRRTFKANVGLYVTLDAAQPVKIYVTGFVRAPGLYAGLSSDSVLAYLDRAGGIDGARGSFLNVQVLRGGQPRARVNLYDFLLAGRSEGLQLQDGDTVVVGARQHTVQVTGEVLNPYIFEFDRPEIAASELLAMARPRPGATHLSVVRTLGAERRSEYHPLAGAAQVRIQDGDEVAVTSDRYPGTILVRIEGAHLGERTLVLPYGARLSDALARLKPAAQANVQALQLFRLSVAERQKQLIDSSLKGLETYALTARSATSEEAALRSREADQILKFIERARQVQPRGQVLLGRGPGAAQTLLENGDVIRVPEQSNLVLVSGEVLFPNALVFDGGADVDTYVSRAGGYTQGADQARVVVLHQDGSVSPEARAVKLAAGDEIMVLPKIETKSVEVTRGITQIVYQIAVAAKVLFGL